MMINCEAGGSLSYTFCKSKYGSCPLIARIVIKDGFMNARVGWTDRKARR